LAESNSNKSGKVGSQPRESRWPRQHTHARRLAKPWGQALRKRPFFSIMVAVGLALILYFSVLEPAWEFLRDNQTRMATRKSTIAGLQKISSKAAEKVAALQSQIAGLAAATKAALKESPEQARQMVMASTRRLAAEVGLKEVKITPSMPRKLSGYTKVGVRLRARGDFASLQKFVERINDNEDFIHTSNYIISSVSDPKGDLLSLDCQVSILAKQ
jgi:type II secretory pathway component PulM